MKAQELREKSAQELRDLEVQLRDQLFRLRMKHYSGQLQNVSELRQVRKDIARIKTVQRQQA